jgi:hypothetical protein
MFKVIDAALVKDQDLELLLLSDVTAQQDKLCVYKMKL